MNKTIQYEKLINNQMLFSQKSKSMLLFSTINSLFNKQQN